MSGTVGVHVPSVAAVFKLDVENRLAEILPARAVADSDDDERPSRSPCPPEAKRDAFGVGSRLTRHPHLGSCRDTGGGGRVYVRKLVVRQRLSFFPASLPFPFGNGRTAAGGYRVSTLIHRGLREDAKSGSLRPRLRHWVFIQRLSGVAECVRQWVSGRC